MRDRRMTRIEKTSYSNSRAREMIFSRREARRGERLRNSARVRASVKEESEMGSGGSGFFVSDDKYISKRTRNGLERCATTTGDWPICETHATRVATHLLPCARSIITTLLRIMYRPSQRRDTEPCCSFFFFFFFFFSLNDRTAFSW